MGFVQALHKWLMTELTVFSIHYNISDFTLSSDILLHLTFMFVEHFTKIDFSTQIS